MPTRTRKDSIAIAGRCTACPLHVSVHKKYQPIGFGRTQNDLQKCSILFVFGSPSNSEHTAGPGATHRARLLRTLMETATRDPKLRGLSWYATYLIRCAPCNLDYDSGHLTVEPRDLLTEDVWACRDNFSQVVTRVAPRVIVGVGAQVTKLIPKNYNAKSIMNLDYVVDRGGVESPEYRQVLRDVIEVIQHTCALHKLGRTKDRL